MAITLRAAGTATGATAAVTAVNPAVPTGATTGDLSVLTVVAKPYNTTITTPSGWTKIAEATNGTTASGMDTGSTYVAMFVRESASVGAIGNLTQTNANTMTAVINTYAQGAAGWDQTTWYTSGGDTTNAANYSATGSAVNSAAGDWILASTAVCGDIGAPSALAIGGMSGATLGSTVTRTNAATTTGNDNRLLAVDVPITAGSSSAAPTFTYTNTSSTSGTTMFFQLRELFNFTGTLGLSGSGALTFGSVVAPTLAATPAFLVINNLTQNGGTALVSPSFTPATGEVLVVKGATEDSQTAPTLPTATGGGITWTSRVSDATASKAAVAIFTGVVTSGGSAITVSMGFNNANVDKGSMSLERWTGATLAATPVTVSTRGGAPGSLTAPSTTLTTTAASSVITWVDGDWSASSPSTAAYRSGAVADGIHDGSPLSYVSYHAYQSAGAAGSQTLGMTAPTQNWNVLGLEVLTTSSGGGGAVVAITAALGLSGGGTLGLAGTPAITPATTLNLSAGGTLALVADPVGVLGLSAEGTLGFASTLAIPAITQNLSASGTLGVAGSFPGGGGTPILEGTPGVYESASATTAVVPFPSGIIAGELLVVHLANSAATIDVTNPGGWTLAASKNNSTGGTPSLAVWYMVATGSETGSVTFTVAAVAGRTTGTMERWSGVDTTTPLDATPVSGMSGIASTFTMPSITTVTPNTLLLHTIGLNAASAADIDTLSGTFKVTGSTGTGRRLGIFSEDKPATGASGTRVWTMTPTTPTLQWAGITLALRPAPHSGTLALTGTGALSTPTATPAWAAPLALAGSGALTMHLYSGAALAATPVFVSVPSSSSDPATTPAFTPATGELLIVKVVNEDAVNFATGSPTATGGGITWTLRASDTTSGYSGVYIWSGVVTSGGSSITVSLAPTVRSGPHLTEYSLSLERWTGASVASSPATASALGSGAPSATLTTTRDRSVISWVSGDYLAVAPGTVGWRSGAEPDGVYNDGWYTGYSAYQFTAPLGAQTIGVSAPTGQKWNLVGLEILEGSEAYTGTLATSAAGTGAPAGTALTLSGAVALAASGTLALSAGTPATAASLALSGAANATETPGLTVQAGACPLSGSGALTLTAATPRPVATLAVTGAGSVALASGIFGAVALSGSGAAALTATPAFGVEDATDGGTATSTYTSTVNIDGGSAAGAAAPAIDGGIATSTFTNIMPLAPAAAGSLVFTHDTAFMGTLALSGSGALALTATPRPVAALALTGAGTAVLAGGINVLAGLGVSGAGTLALSGKPGLVSALNLSGSGTLTLAALVLGGSGTLTTSGIAGMAGACALSGGGVQSLTRGLLTQAGTLALAGTGTPNFAGAIASAVSAVALSAGGTLSLAGGKIAADALALTASGALGGAQSGMGATTALPLTAGGTLSGVGVAVSGTALSLATAGTTTLTGTTAALSAQAALGTSGTLALLATGYSGAGSLTLSGAAGFAGSLAQAGDGGLALAIGTPGPTGTIASATSGTLDTAASDPGLKQTLGRSAIGALTALISGQSATTTLGTSASGSLTAHGTVLGTCSPSATGTLSLLGAMAQAGSIGQSGTGSMLLITGFGGVTPLQATGSLTLILSAMVQTGDLPLGADGENLTQDSGVSAFGALDFLTDGTLSHGALTGVRGSLDRGISGGLDGFIATMSAAQLLLFAGIGVHDFWMLPPEYGTLELGASCSSAVMWIPGLLTARMMPSRYHVNISTDRSTVEI